MEGNLLVIGHKKQSCGHGYCDMRGMWEVRKAPIGGPFVAMYTLDSLRRTVLATEGFVYSPSTEKRDLIRLVEASLLTIRKQK